MLQKVAYNVLRGLKTPTGYIHAYLE